MKMTFKNAYKLLMAADIVQVASMGERESVSICTSGRSVEVADYFTVLWESEDGEDYTFDVHKLQNVKVEKNKNRLTFITTEDTENEVLELFLYKQVPLLK